MISKLFSILLGGLADEPSPTMDLPELETSKDVDTPAPIDGQIPTIELRAATFDGQADPEAQSTLSSSPAPSSPRLTACETASSISSQDIEDDQLIVAIRKFETELAHRAEESDQPGVPSQEAVL